MRVSKVQTSVEAEELLRLFPRVFRHTEKEFQQFGLYKTKVDQLRSKCEMGSNRISFRNIQGFD